MKGVALLRLKEAFASDNLEIKGHGVRLEQPSKPMWWPKVDEERRNG